MKKYITMFRFSANIIFIIISAIHFCGSMNLDAKTVYMSSTGDDANQGIEEAPVKTFNRAKQLCKNSSDASFEILLKGGDTFTEFQAVTVSLYGDDQTTFAFVWNINKPLKISTYGPEEKAHLYGAGYYSHSGGPGQAILIIDPSSKDVLIENLFFEMWELGTIMVFESEDVHIRNIKIDKVGPYYFPEEKTTGVYCAGVIYPKNSTRILIEDVVMTNCHNNYNEVGALHGFYCTRLNHSEIRNCYLANISGSPFKFRRKPANNCYVHDNECYYTGVSTQTPNQVQFGFLRYSGDPGGNCPYALVFENNKFHYPYCWVELENPETAMAVRCTISNEESCGSDACMNPERVEWINNDFKYKWELTEHWTGPDIIVPDAPSNLTAVAVSDKQIDLTWTDNSDDEDGFYIERKSGASSWFQIGSVDSNVTTYSDKFFLSPATTYTYRVAAYRELLTSPSCNEVTETTLDPTKVVDNTSCGTPKDFRLEQNYPNPFNPSTTISYQLPKTCGIQLNVFDINGTFIKKLLDSFQMAGVYRVMWQPTNLPSGHYLVQLQAGDFKKSIKVVYLR
ncbi:T9SS C-terminal target domain-containing protein [candidate division KSB1 bacterium]|nr:T9SS type A sorting domain-containing protein [candidate division KSB1 bacterium]RQW02348.1 MAG: T9SS C-terminal target domain-containing protein [candidate division KSB1 bacterium]